MYVRTHEWRTPIRHGPWIADEKRFTSDDRHFMGFGESEFACSLGLLIPAICFGKRPKKVSWKETGRRCQPAKHHHETVSVAQSHIVASPRILRACIQPREPISSSCGSFEAQGNPDGSHSGNSSRTKSLRDPEKRDLVLKPPQPSSGPYQIAHVGTDIPSPE